MSIFQVQKYLPKTPVIVYSDFSKLDSLDSLLAPTGQFVFLYEWVPAEGHFCCCWENSDGIHVFDPLAFKPDSELGHVEKKYKKQLFEDKPYLSQLLKKSGKKIFYNKYKLQKLSTSVCGRECIVRLAFRDLNEKQYSDMWKGADVDAIVSKVII